MEPPKPHYHPPYIKHEEQDNEVVQQKISPEAEEEIEQAEEKAKKEKIVNEVQELLKQYEELIIIKEQHVEERLTVIKEKEEITIKRENEIYEASERIRQPGKGMQGAEKGNNSGGIVSFFVYSSFSTTGGVREGGEGVISSGFTGVGSIVGIIKGSSSSVSLSDSLIVSFSSSGKLIEHASPFSSSFSFSLLSNS